MRQPVGGDAQRAAGAGVDVDLMTAKFLDTVIVAMRNSDVDTGAGADNVSDRNAGVFERPPGRFEQHSLLRVHDRGFAWRNSEKRAVEGLDVVDEAAPSR